MIYDILLNVYSQLLVLFSYRIGLMHSRGLFTIAVILICSQHFMNHIITQCGQRSGLLMFQYRRRCPVSILKLLHASRILNIMEISTNLNIPNPILGISGDLNIILTQVLILKLVVYIVHRITTGFVSRTIH